MDVAETTGRAAAAPGPTAGRRRSTLVWRAVSIAAVLALLVLLVGEVTGSMSQQGGAPAGHGGHLGHYDDQAADADGVLIELQAQVAADGLAPALARVRTLVAADMLTVREAHFTVHDLGRAAQSSYGTPAAFGECDGSFHSGCYHGVVQGHIVSKPVVDRVELATFCWGGVIDATTVSLQAQCVHGVGHGLGALFGTDLRAALDHCDALPASPPRDEARHRCYGGAFMQRVDSDPPPVDLCAGLDARHLTSCHFYRVMAVFRAGDRDVAAAFAECDLLEPRYAVACHEGMGRVAGTVAAFDPDQTQQLCRQGAPPYQPHCVRGAAQYLIGMLGSTEPAGQLCAVAPVGTRTGCFEMVGLGAALLHPDPAGRATACSGMPPEWVPVCREAAGLDPHGSP